MTHLPPPVKVAHFESLDIWRLGLLVWRCDSSKILFLEVVQIWFYWLMIIIIVCSFKMCFSSWFKKQLKPTVLLILAKISACIRHAALEHVDRMYVQSRMSALLTLEAVGRSFFDVMCCRYAHNVINIFYLQLNHRSFGSWKAPVTKRRVILTKQSVQK